MAQSAPNPGFPRAFPRERAIVMAALALVIGLAWADLAWMANGMRSGAAMPDMPGMPGMSDMPGMAEMAGMAMAPVVQWSAGYFAAMLAMWAVMMAAMMLPSATPTILLYVALRRHAERPAIAPALLFAAGYLLAWTAFSVLATGAQWALSHSMLLAPDMAVASRRVAGVLLLAAGIYQFTPLKRACLAKCRAPAQFLVQHRRDGTLGPLVMGLHHGAFCVGCCAALMALLFAFGVMNLLWVAAIAAFVLVEKLLPSGPRLGWIAGAALLAAGVVSIV